MATIRSSSGEPLSRFIAPACLSVGSEDVQPAPLGLRRDFKVYRNRYLQLQAYQNLMEAIAAGESDNSKADDDVSGKVAHVLKIVEKSRASKTSLIDALERASISASALEALQMQAADATVVVNRALETSRAGKTEDEEKCKELLREQTEAIRVVTDEKDAFQNELYDLDCKRVPLLQRLRSNRAKLEELKHFSIDASTAATRVERLTEIQRWYDCINSVLSSVWGVRLLAESIAERKVTLDFYHNAATPGETGISTATLEVEFNIDAVDGGSAVLAVKAATLSSDVPIDDIVRAAQSAKGGKGLGATSGFAFLLREVRARLESWRRGGAFKCPR